MSNLRKAKVLCYVKHQTPQVHDACASLLRKAVRCPQNTDVVWRDSQGVKVRGQFVYSKGNGDTLGKFVCAFEHLKFDYI